jgi:hypothetical protein
VSGLRVGRLNHLSARRLALGLAVIAFAPGAAYAQTMPVSTFLAKADALQKKGALALLSGDIGKLKARS